jgi:hypothetical protein
LPIIRVLFGVILAILRTAVSSFMLFSTVLLSSAVALAVVALVAVSLTGVVTLRLSRRRAAKRLHP